MLSFLGLFLGGIGVFWCVFRYGLVVCSGAVCVWWAVYVVVISALSLLVLWGVLSFLGCFGAIRVVCRLLRANFFLVPFLLVGIW